METLAEQPVITETEQFDRLVRTRNDAETWLAEILDGSMRTPFEYSYDGKELFAEDGGALKPIFDDSITDAKRIAQKDPSLAFELRRRLIEADEYKCMLAMAKGELPNIMVVVSDFPPELMNASQDVGGYNVQRKQTMLRVISAHEGKISMYSQSLDGSDRTALEAIYAHLDVIPEEGELLAQRIHVQVDPEHHRFLTSEITGAHDRSLVEQYGGEWHAGRLESPVGVETYSFVRSQNDLVERFVELEITGRLRDAERYNIAALMAKRYLELSNPVTEIVPEKVLMGGLLRNLDWQLQLAGREARQSGRSFSGCGITMRAEQDTMSASEQLDRAGYGSLSSDEDDKGSLTFKCKNGHTNRRPRGKLIKQCKIKGCEDSVGC